MTRSDNRTGERQALISFTSCVFAVMHGSGLWRDKGRDRHIWHSCISDVQDDAGGGDTHLEHQQGDDRSEYRALADHGAGYAGLDYLEAAVDRDGGPDAHL